MSVAESSQLEALPRPTESVAASSSSSSSSVPPQLATRTVMLRPFWYDCNPFFVAGLLFGSAAAAAWYLTKQQPQRTLSGTGPGTGTGSGSGSGSAMSARFQRIRAVLLHRPYIVTALYILTAICAVGTILFEYYYQWLRCSTSNDYQQRLSAFTRSVIDALTAHGDVFWVDFASLLAIIREQAIPWDPDHDLSMVMPKDLVAFRSFLSGAGFPNTYSESRQLIQLFDPSHQLHVDIWLWTQLAIPAADVAPHIVAPVITPIPEDPSAPHVPTNIDDLAFSLLYNPEPGTQHQKRPRSELIPLQHVFWRGIDRRVPIPHNPQAVSRAEYGPSYMTAQWSRADCFHNAFALRWL